MASHGSSYDHSRPNQDETAGRRVDLPFTVRIVRNDDQLSKAIRIRAEAYGRHAPILGAKLAAPEQTDRDPDSIVFLAEAKNDSEPLGTIRIQTNFEAPLTIEQSITLPTRFIGRPLAGISRLAVRAGPRGRMVKLALFKAMHRYCLAKQVEWIVIGARPSLEKDYESLGFVDVFEDKAPRPLLSANGIPHRILAFEIPTAERKWLENNHPLYLFMFRRFHPDIQIFSSVSSMWKSPRKARDADGRPGDGSALNLPII